MPPLVANLNFLIASGILLSHILLIALIFLHFFGRKYEFARSAFRFLSQYALLFAFLLASASVGMSLLYSEVFGFVPCGLCWMQRVFLYPQAVILAIAWWKKDTAVGKYIIALSVFGALFALDQHFLQMGVGEFLPCPASGESDCGQRILFEFGYITFPLVSLTAFLWQIAFMLFARQNEEK